jgi:hypothetical protein
LRRGRMSVARSDLWPNSRRRPADPMSGSCASLVSLPASG